uniref:Uncharacterized protein n=1 Tax=Brassica campestris TaxID=3711 RepID=A0A3P5Z0U8_BRACM|nr:unnamed protein product [Brassica rapa]
MLEQLKLRKQKRNNQIMVTNFLLMFKKIMNHNHPFLAALQMILWKSSH